MPYAGILEESVSAVTATNSVELGARREVGENSYRYVFNAGGEQINQGLGCTISGTTGYSVTVSSVCGTHLLAGVCVHATLTTDTYGWICTQGQANVSGNTQTLVGKGVKVALSLDGAFSTAAADAAGFSASAMTGSAGMFNIWFKSQLL